MSQNIDIKALWKRKEVQIPDVQELIEKINNFKMQKLKILLLTNLVVLLSCAFIIIVWVYYQPQLITTKVGIIIIITSMVINLVVGNRILPLLLKANQQNSNREYLQTLLKFKEMQKFLLHTNLNIYFIMLSMGLCLYLYEYTSRMRSPWGIATYGVLFFWIALNWFYLRPRSIRKQERRLNDLILKSQSLSKQLEEPNIAERKLN